MHSFWAASRGLAVWAEDSGRAVTSRSQALTVARHHPFAATTDTLTSMLPDGTPGSAALSLPSLAKSPLDSPELVRVRPRQPGSAPSLLAWTVPTLALAPAAALAWLADDTPVDDVRRGASVTYLAALARFAEELADRGRFLPSVADGAAVWRPVLQGPDVLAFGWLVTAMPPVCRAVASTVAPDALALTALTALVDASVRQRVADVALVPPRRGRRPAQLPVAETWLSALTSIDGRLDAPTEAVGALEEALRPWADVGLGQTGPAQATFRLVAPEPDATEPEAPVARWQVDFLLQSTADPSLLVAADQVWSDDGTLHRWLENPRQLLLRELGRAARVFPALAGGMRQARPTGLSLDTADAYDFLTTAAPALEQAGFGVLLPAWWDRRARLGLKLSVATPTDPGSGTEPTLGQDGLCAFRWRLAVGDSDLTDEEIAALAKAKAPLVRVRGEWLALSPEQLRQGLDFLQHHGTGQMTASEVIGLAASHPDDRDLPFAITSVTADGWLGTLLDGGDTQGLHPVDPPASFTATLRPYQRRGLSWLSFLAGLGLGACLADDMGLGKTVQVLALEAHDRSAAARQPTLLLCPMSLVGNWQREATRFAPDLRVYAHHGPQRHRGEALTAHLRDVDLVVTTYGTASRDLTDLAERSWHRVVLDEAQAIKNSLSQSSVAARSLRAGHRVALTGTPVENRLAELWSLLDFLNPGMLSTREKFRQRYAIPVERYADPDAAARLRTVTRPYLLRRLKTDPAIIDDLPEKIEIKQYARLTVEQASLYQSVVDDMMERIENSAGIERRGLVLATMAKLKQVCNHPALLLHDRSAIGRRSGKVNRLEEILEEILAADDRVLCFTQFTEFAEMILPHLAARFGTDLAYLHGGTTRQRRDELVARFQSGDGPPVFLLSLKAGGTGLNLTAANHVVHLDRWWNPAVEDQATDRAFRIGQRRNVEVHKFICTGTLEEKIDDMIEAKKALANLVVSDGEGWLTELSTAQLRTLFTLSEAGSDE